MKELNDALGSNEKLQTKCKRLERKREQLKSEIESIKEDRSRIIVKNIIFDTNISTPCFSDDYNLTMENTE